MTKFATQKGLKNMRTTREPVETVRAKVRGYDCEYTQGVFTVTDTGHKWDNGTLVGLLTLKIEYVDKLQTFRNIRGVRVLQFGQDEEPSVQDVQELMGELMTSYPLLGELDVCKTVTHFEEEDTASKKIKKWKHIYYEIAPDQGPLRFSLSEVVHTTSPENTEETIASSESKIRPGGKKARKAAAALAVQEEAKA